MDIALRLSLNGDQKLGRRRQNCCGKEAGFAALSLWRGLCCVTLGPGDPSCHVRHALAQETKGQLSTLSSLPFGLGEKPQSFWWGLAMPPASHPVVPASVL